jgi:Tfp pilus assembly protein PilF/4-amino-4-deoxy-L-arabinose transferase-like glycosyltransferase
MPFFFFERTALTATGLERILAWRGSRPSASHVDRPDQAPGRLHLSAGALRVSTNPAIREGSPSTRRHLLLLLAILALALIIRISYVVQMRDDPFFQHLSVNAASFDAAGWAIAEGRADDSAAYFHPPLYAYFLGFIYRLFGHSPQATRIIQALLGTIACLLVYLIGRRAFDPTVGLWSAAAAAVFWPFIFFTGEILPATLALVLILFALWLFLVAAAARRFLGWAAAGAALGAGALVRPNLLLSLPLLALTALAFERPVRRSVLAAVLYLAGAALPILPVAARNYLVADEFVLISANGGHNLYLGNGPAADGMNPFPDESTRSLLTEMAREGLASGAQSARFVALTLDWVRAHPGRTLSLLLKKCVLWWNAYEIPNNRDLYAARSRSPLLRLPWLGFALVGPLGIVGAVLALRVRAAAPLLVFLASYTLSVMPFFVCARFRLPVVPILILLAVFSLRAISRSWRDSLRTRPRHFVGVVALLVGAAVLVNSNFYGLRGTTFFEIEYNSGWVLSRAGDDEGAARAYRRAIAIERRTAAIENLALTFERLGRTDDALSLYAEAIERSPETATNAYNNTGTILKDRGDLEGAMAMFRRAIETDSTYLFSYLNLADCCLRTGQRDEAVRLLERALRLNPPPQIEAQIRQVLAAERGAAPTQR